MLLETRSSPPFFKNGFVVACDRTREAIVIDPGDEIVDLVDIVRRHALGVRHILLTHAHVDHVAGVAEAKRVFGARIGLHIDDRVLYDAAVRQGLAFGYRIEEPPPPDFFLEPGVPLSFGTHEIRAHHTPGHSPGGVCLEVRHASEARTHLFVGDTLFAGSIGRTDLPGGDLATLLRSIREVLFAFGDDALVHPGHGPATTIGEERRTNPFLTGEM
ncbi:MAG: MBL fold metallo-hydrolase [Acidobacteriota bacterium]